MKVTNNARWIRNIKIPHVYMTYTKKQLPNVLELLNQIGDDKWYIVKGPRKYRLCYDGEPVFTNDENDLQMKLFSYHNFA
jgi:hypothetical protein